MYSRKRETLFSGSSSSHPWRADCSNTSVLVKFFWSLIVMNIDELDCPWHINLQFRSNPCNEGQSSQIFSHFLSKSMVCR